MYREEKEEILEQAATATVIATAEPSVDPLSSVSTVVDARLSRVSCRFSC